MLKRLLAVAAVLPAGAAPAARVRRKGILSREVNTGLDMAPTPAPGPSAWQRIAGLTHAIPLR